MAKATKGFRRDIIYWTVDKDDIAFDGVVGRAAMIAEAVQDYQKRCRKERREFRIIHTELEIELEDDYSGAWIQCSLKITVESSMTPKEIEAEEKRLERQRVSAQKAELKKQALAEQQRLANIAREREQLVKLAEQYPDVLDTLEVRKGPKNDSNRETS